jgi:hypothetical protein
MRSVPDDTRDLQGILGRPALPICFGIYPTCFFGLIVKKPPEMRIHYCFLFSFGRCSDFIQAGVETNVKAKGRAKQKKEQSKRAIPGETK